MSERPFWLALLASWCANREGLALPFIVGADAIRRGTDVAPQDTRRIFREICVSSTPTVCLRHCPIIGVPILAIHPYPQGRIQVALNSNWGANDEEKLNTYVGDAENLVRAGLFSRVGDYPHQKWAPFQKADLYFIASVIQGYDNA
jgi:hypothetical protein